MENSRSMRGRFHAAVLAGLTASMAFSGVVPALAETGKVQIKQNTINKDTTYEGYRLFKADIATAGGQDKAQNITWDTDADKAKVLAFLSQGVDVTGASQTYEAWLTAHNHTATGAGDLAQNAAEYIAEMINGSAEDEGANTTPKTTTGTSFATNFAQYLNSNQVTVDVPHLATDTDYTGDQGYYLFVTTASTIGTDESGTAPVWVAVSDTAKEIQEKTATVTVEKQVKEDSTAAYGKTADANKDQLLNFKITGTMPQNYGAYDTYKYVFTDTLPGGMSLAAGNTSTVKVKMYANAAAATADADGAAGTDVTNKFSITYESDTLTVGNTNLKDATNGISGVTKDTVFVVYYQARLDNDAVIGSTGNTNTVHLTYTNDPITNSDGTTTDKKTTTYTYELDIEKVDKDTREKLAGAKFTIQLTAAEGASDTASVGKYLQSDGSLGDTQYEFTTNENGKITVPRIDRGTYTIHETAAPTHYDTIDADVVVTIGATVPTEPEAAIETMTATYSGGEAYADSHPGKVPTGGQATDATDGIYTINAESSKGVIGARIGDPRVIVLPGTGMTPSQLGTIVGAALLAGGIFIVVKRQREDAQLG